ncbi:hypothetical protein [Streptomyces sp. NPDC005141]
MASSGDAKRLYAVFGLSIKLTHRYTNVGDHPGFTDGTPST